MIKINPTYQRMIDGCFFKWQIISFEAGLRPKTRQIRKIHFAWAFEGDYRKFAFLTSFSSFSKNRDLIQCETRINKNTLTTAWAPLVTCSHCRELMVKAGITSMT